MSQSVVVLGGTEIAAAMRDLAGQRLVPVAMPGRGELAARDGVVHGIEPAWDLLRTAGAGAELATVGVATSGVPFDDRVKLSPAIDGRVRLAFGRDLRAASADSAPEVTSTGAVA